MNRNDEDTNLFETSKNNPQNLDEYDRLLEEMEMQVKELKKIKKKKKKLMELEMEKEEILRKMNKNLKNKHR